MCRENTELIKKKLFEVFGEEYSRANELVNQILDMDILSDSDSLTKLRDATEMLHASFLQLKSLSDPIDMDGHAYIWRPILLRRLDQSLRHEFFVKHPEKQPKPSDVIEFLRSRTAALERATSSATASRSSKSSKNDGKGTATTAAFATTDGGNKSKKKGSKGSKNQQQQSSQQSSNQTQQQSQTSQQQQSSSQKQKSASANREPCAFCESVEHFSRKCPELKNLDVDQRWSFVAGKRCPRCLCLSHATGEVCRFDRACSKCEKAHHKILCRATKN